MYRNTPNPDQQTLLFEDFQHPFGIKLNPNNRWVKLAEIIPWQDYEEHYARQLSHSKGAPALSFRTALGSLIIKEMLGLSDRATVEQISENPYLQFFIGLPSFQIEVPFNHSMFSHFRKRISMDLIQSLNETIVLESAVEENENSQNKTKINDDHSDNDRDNIQTDEKSTIAPEAPPEHVNQGKLLLDATCAPSDIRYPTDLSLLDEAREKTEMIIDVLWGHAKKHPAELKPRTYRIKARKQALSVLRKKRCSKTEIRKAIRQQLEHVQRNLNSINDLKARVDLRVLSRRLYQNLLVVAELQRQQKEMYKQGKKSIANRIVSISQPHVRPIVRGKAASPVEFGAKISVSDVDGFVYLDRLEWEAYHEGEDLIIQAEAYRRRFGFFPLSIHADKAYQTRSNRSWCKERGIRLSGPKLGRPPVETQENLELIKKERQIQRQDEIDRIEIEGKFGVAKRRYGLGRIMAKLRVSAQTMVALPLFVMNLEKILRDLFCFIFHLVIFILIQRSLSQKNYNYSVL